MDEKEEKRSEDTNSKEVKNRKGKSKETIKHQSFQSLINNNNPEEPTTGVRQINSEKTTMPS